MPKLKLKETNLDIEALLTWASFKKKTDASLSMLISFPEMHGVFLACPKGIYHGLFIVPINTSLSTMSAKLRAWGYAVYRAKDNGKAMDYLIEYTNEL
jgi:hypothetical protein